MQNGTPNCEFRMQSSGNRLDRLARRWNGDTWFNEAVFESAGIETLAVEDGRDICRRSTCGGKEASPWMWFSWFDGPLRFIRDAPLKLPAEMAAAIADPRRFPLIDKLISLDEGKHYLIPCLWKTIHSWATTPSMECPIIEGDGYGDVCENSLLLLPGNYLAGWRGNIRFAYQDNERCNDSSCWIELVSSEGDLGWVKWGLYQTWSIQRARYSASRGSTTKLRLGWLQVAKTWHHSLRVSDAPKLAPPDGELQHHSSFIYLRYFHGLNSNHCGGVPW